MPEDLKDYRKKIDNIDEQIIKLLKDREDIVKKVAIYKIEHNMIIEQPEREKEIFDRPKDKYIKDIFKIIIENSREVQKIEKYKC